MKVDLGDQDFHLFGREDELRALMRRLEVPHSGYEPRVASDGFKRSHARRRPLGGGDSALGLHLVVETPDAPGALASSAARALAPFGIALAGNLEEGAQLRRAGRPPLAARADRRSPRACRATPAGATS